MRLDNEGYEKLKGWSQETNLDFSFLVRDAIAKYLDGQPAHQNDTRPTVGPVMPAAAFALTGPYRAWSGDLRAELRNRFLTLLALSHVTAECWPKTKGIREVYVALLSVCHHLGIV